MELHAQSTGVAGLSFIPAGAPDFDAPTAPVLSVSTSVLSTPPNAAAATEVPLLDLPLHELQVRVVRSAADMEEVAELRCEIDLAAAMAADPRYLEREKKEKKLDFRLPLIYRAR